MVNVSIIRYKYHLVIQQNLAIVVKIGSAKLGARLIMIG